MLKVVFTDIFALQKPHLLKHIHFILIWMVFFHDFWVNPSNFLGKTGFIACFIKRIFTFLHTFLAMVYRTRNIKRVKTNLNIAWHWSFLKFTVNVFTFEYFFNWNSFYNLWSLFFGLINQELHFFLKFFLFFQCGIGTLSKNFKCIGNNFGLITI